MGRNKLVAVLIALGALISACNHNSATAQDRGAGDQQPPAEEASASGSDALVRINDEVITKNLFALYFAEKQRAGQLEGNAPQQQLAALNELTNLVLVAEDAKSRKLDDREGVRAALELQRINLLARLAIQERVKAHTPSDEELKKRHEDRIAGGTNREYKARHILLKTEDEAKAVIAKLDEGADFAELARTKSVGPSGPSGGNLGWFEPSKMVKPFSDAVADMEDGNHSRTPVQTQFGWHVILREESRELPVTEFADAKQTLLAEAQQKALQDYIRELREKAKVEYVRQQQAADPVSKP